MFILAPWVGALDSNQMCRRLGAAFEDRVATCQCVGVLSCRIGGEVSKDIDWPINVSATRCSVVFFIPMKASCGDPSARGRSLQLCRGAAVVWTVSCRGMCMPGMLLVQTCVTPSTRVVVQRATCFRLHVCKEKPPEARHQRSGLP